MAKRDVLNKILSDAARSVSTSREEMGFKYTINAQVEFIARIKSSITPSDSDQDFIETVLMFERSVEVLEDLLTNEVDNDTKLYKEMLDDIEKHNIEIIPFSEFLSASYTSKSERREKIDSGSAGVKYNRYRAEKKLNIESLRWRGLMKLMKRNNLLLKSKEWVDE